jgi:hypothetical protein
MATFHFLSQYIWPDGGPDGILAEQLAVHLHEKLGHDVRLVGGTGTYRRSGRLRPQIPLVQLDHYHARRGNLVGTFAQYCAVSRAFRQYIEESVRPDDVAIVTSAPPTTVSLAMAIKRRGARAIYWLQDYYPEIVRGIYDYPAAMRAALCAYWDKNLQQWDRVVKSASNLGRDLKNAIVIRNWPTLQFQQSIDPEPKTALYSGNLGYGHDVDLLVESCERLRDDGYTINIRADGRGVALLPAWLKAKPLHANPNLLREALLHHEVHLIAAHPKIQHAIFPSKIWNSIAARRRLVCTGFIGAMREELELSKSAPFDRHLEQWAHLLATIPEVAPSASAAQLEPAVA